MGVVKKYLGKTFLRAPPFLIGHFYDFPDLLDEGLSFTFQDEFTRHLKQKEREVELP